MAADPLPSPYAEVLASLRAAGSGTADPAWLRVDFHRAAIPVPQSRFAHCCGVLALRQLYRRGNGTTWGLVRAAADASRAAAA